MKRILSAATFLFGDATRERVFEPLVADMQREIEGNRSYVLRARWWLAIALTTLRSLPRAAFAGVRLQFILALAGRGVAFLTLAFVAQWLLGLRLRPHSAAAWPPAAATTFFFMMTPVIWRIRRESIPIYQQRLLVIAFLIVCVAGSWLATAASGTLAAAMLLGGTWLTLTSWRMYRAIIVEHTPVMAWATGVYPATSIIVAGVPVKLALGMGLWQPLWPGNDLAPFAVGLVIGLTTGVVQHSEAPYRALYKRLAERLVTDRHGRS